MRTSVASLRAANSIYSATETSVAPCLPFLYKTRTILGQRHLTVSRKNGDGYNTRDQSHQVQQSRRISYRPLKPIARDLDRPESYYDSHHYDSRFGNASPPPRPGDVRSRLVADSQFQDFVPFEDHLDKHEEQHAGNAAHPRLGDVRSRVSAESQRQDFVPFEGPDSVPGVSADSRSSITDSERRTFEQLRGLTSPEVSGIRQEEVRTQPQTRHPYSDLDAIIDQAMADIKTRVNRETERNARDLFLGSKKAAQSGAGSLSIIKIAYDSGTSKRETLQEGEMRRIGTLLSRAGTDIEAWNIIQDQIIAPIATLYLDRRPEEAENPTNQSKARREAKIESFNPEDGSSNDAIMSIMGPIFPSLLAEAARILRDVFPTSKVLLSIIPLLRRFGPSVYAMGASTQLYNESILLLHEKYLDVPAVVDLLNEMEREVIEPDEQTFKCLERLIAVAAKIQRGGFGSATKAWWESGRMRRAVADLQEWGKRLEAQLKERRPTRVQRVPQREV